MGNRIDFIKEKARVDKRIIYCGLLPRTEVIKKQREATVLVNPRTPEGEFTKYSFPSKTIEYLASGVQTLIYRLPSIPEEYYNYCFSISELGVDALSRKIDEILNMNNNERADIGAKARVFIKSQKNPYRQCEKVLDLIRYIK